MTAKKPTKNALATVGRQVPITDARKATFIRVLRETGSTYAAARAATPWSRDKIGGGYSSFKDLAKRDPLFAAEWERAEQDFIGTIEAEIARRAMQPSKRSVVSGGEVVAVDEVPPDPKLLMFMLERVRPDKWAKREKIEISGTVDHRHAHVGVMLDVNDLYLLPADKRQHLIGLLAELTEARESLEAQTARPAPLALVDERPTVSTPAEAETDNG